MLRTLICTAVALAICVSPTLAEEKKKKKPAKKGASVTGTISKVDATGGKITIKVKKKKETEEKEYTVTKETVVTDNTGDEKKEVKADSATDLLKNTLFKEGTAVTITTDEEGKTAKTITFGKAKKKKKAK